MSNLGAAYTFNVEGGGTQTITLKNILWIKDSKVIFSEQRAVVTFTDEESVVANILGLIKLTEASDSGDIYLDRDKIRDVRPRGSEAIVLYATRQIDVEESVSEVLNEINYEPNSVYGFEAGSAVTTGVKNALFGERAGYAITTGSRNQCFGFQAGAALTTEQNTTIMGRQAASITSAVFGNGITVIGNQAARDVDGGGQNGIFIGSQAAYEAGDLGVGNTIVGSVSAPTLNGGNYNSGLGYGVDPVTFDNCVLLGRGAIATADNQLVIGDSTYPVGTIATETVTADTTILVRWNGANYKLIAEAQ